MRPTYKSGPNTGANKRISCDMRDAWADRDWYCRDFGCDDLHGSPDFHTYQIAGGDTCRFALVPDGPNQGNLGDWMSSLDGHMPLFELFIPGTHDSACSGRGRAAGNIDAQTQENELGSIREQLDQGVRAFDLRFEYVNNSFSGEDVISVHTVNMYYSAKDIMNELGEWQARHPQEFVFAKMRGNEDCTAIIKAAIKGSYNGGHDYTHCFWYSKDWPRTVNEARGKVLILGEKGLGSPENLGGIWGADFALNCRDAVCCVGHKNVHVQDNYDIASYDGKWDAVKAMLHKSMGGLNAQNNWFYNFTSASHFIPMFWPKPFACGNGEHWGQNRRLFYHLTTFTSTGIGGESWSSIRPPRGIVWMDYFREPMNLNALPRIMAAINHAPRSFG